MHFSLLHVDVASAALVVVVAALSAVAAVALSVFVVAAAALVPFPPDGALLFFEHECHSYCSQILFPASHLKTYH